jgi:F-type H+-transporting ATPase subunit b
MALPLLLCETFLKRSCRRGATVVAALVALSGVPVDDADARQSQPGAGPAAHAPAPAQAPATGTPHATPAPETPVEAGQPAADAAHAAAPHSQPAPAAGDHAAPATPAPADAAHGQPPAHGPPAEGTHDAGTHGATGGQGHGGAEHESIWATIARLFNFAVLAGGLFYFLRAPLAQYLATRDQQIRGGLLSARETSDRATTQLADIDRRLAALPAEIEALRARGVAEIAAEEKRIQADAEAERKRLLEDMQRDVDIRVRVAKKMLTERAADLAVTLAAQRVKETMTDADRARLIDRYTAQVKDIHG